MRVYRYQYQKKQEEGRFRNWNGVDLQPEKERHRAVVFGLRGTWNSEIFCEPTPVATLTHGGHRPGSEGTANVDANSGQRRRRLVLFVVVNFPIAVVVDPVLHCPEVVRHGQRRTRIAHQPDATDEFFWGDEPLVVGPLKPLLLSFRLGGPQKILKV